MDNIKSLIDNGNYDLVIKLTQNSEDPNMIIYCASAYLAKGCALDALHVIESKKAFLFSNLPLLIKTHIEILCLLNRFDDAYAELKRYEELPYESQVVEEILREMPNYIRNEEKKSYGHHKDNSEERVHALLSSKDKKDVLYGLNLMRKFNVNSFISEISNIMKRFPNQMIRNYALLTLIENKINQTFSLLHNGKEITINPSLMKYPFDKKFLDDITLKIGEFTKDQTIIKTGVQMISSYRIYAFPDEFKYSLDELGLAAYSIASKYILSKPEFDLDDKAFELGVDIDNLTKLINEITDSLANE